MSNDAAKPADRPKNVFPELPSCRILEELARTPKGVVYKASRQIERDVVVVKHLRRGQCEKRLIEGLASHAETAFFLEHPGLVRTLGCVNDTGRVLLIMEYAPGEALARTLKQGLPVSLARAVKIIQECATALQYAAGRKQHHGRLHPGDIILSEDKVRLLGVGMGERPEHAPWSAQNRHLFEPLVYAAPEAMPSQSFPSDEAALNALDVYALGALFFHLLTGNPPFRGGDEGALVTERQSISSPVEWPVVNSVPAELRALTEKMLAREATARPHYEDLISALSGALQGVEHGGKSEAGAVAPAPQKLAHSGALGGIRSVPVPHVPASVYLPPRPADPAEYARKRRKRTAASYTTALAVLTAVVFTFAMTKAYFYVPPSSAPATPSGPSLAPVAPTNPAVTEAHAPVSPVVQPAPTLTVPAPAPGPTAVAPRPAIVPNPAAVSPITGEDPLVAARQLEMIEEMLKKGEVRHSPALLKVVKRIAETVGKDTPNGLRAVVLAAEIEETLQQKVFPPATPTAPAVAQVPTAEQPPVAKSNPPAAPTPPEQPAVKPAGQEVVDAAKSRAALAEALKNAMGMAAKFKYADATDTVEKAALYVEQDNRKVAQDYVGLVKQEQAFFQRCRKRLLDEIERNPRKESPLQVSRKNDPVRQDIVDFDEKGIKVSVRAASITIKTYDWEKVPNAQALSLMHNLSDKNNVDDQVGLAAFCFNRGLAADSEAALEVVRSLPNGKDKGEPVAELCKTVSALVGAPQK